MVETLLTAAVITVSVFALWLVLRKVRRPWQIDEQHWRLGLLAWIMLGGPAIAMAVIGHLGWRRVSRTEAAMFLQDGLWHETRREQRRINRWRAWAAAEAVNHHFAE